MEMLKTLKGQRNNRISNFQKIRPMPIYVSHFARILVGALYYILYEVYKTNNYRERL